MIGPTGARQNGPALKNTQICGSITGCRVTFGASDWIEMVD